MKAIHYTPRAKKVVKLSQDEARKLSHPYVGTEHILLGLIREGEGVAARVLHNLDVSLNKARQQVLQLLGNNESDRKSTRLNSSHVAISYAVFCLKKKKKSSVNNTNNR